MKSHLFPLLQRPFLFFWFRVIPVGPTFRGDTIPFYRFAALWLRCTICRLAVRGRRCRKSSLSPIFVLCFFFCLPSFSPHNIFCPRTSPFTASPPFMCNRLSYCKILFCVDLSTMRSLRFQTPSYLAAWFFEEAFQVVSAFPTFAQNPFLSFPAGGYFWVIPFHHSHSRSVIVHFSPPSPWHRTLAFVFLELFVSSGASLVFSSCKPRFWSIFYPFPRVPPWR